MPTLAKWKAVAIAARRYCDAKVNTGANEEALEEIMEDIIRDPIVAGALTAEDPYPAVAAYIAARYPEELANVLFMENPAP